MLISTRQWLSMALNIDHTCFTQTTHKPRSYSHTKNAVPPAVWPHGPRASTCAAATLVAGTVWAQQGEERRALHRPTSGRAPGSTIFLRNFAILAGCLARLEGDRLIGETGFISALYMLNKVGCQRVSPCFSFTARS